MKVAQRVTDACVGSNVSVPFRIKLFFVNTWTANNNKTRKICNDQQGNEGTTNMVTYFRGNRAQTIMNINQKKEYDKEAHYNKIDTFEHPRVDPLQEFVFLERFIVVKCGRAATLRRSTTLGHYHCSADDDAG